MHYVALSITKREARERKRKPKRALWKTKFQELEEKMESKRKRDSKGFEKNGNK